MARKRKADNAASAGVIVAILVVLASAAVLAYLPLAKGRAGAKFFGVLGIIGGLASLVWFVIESDAPPPEIRYLAIASGCTYAVGLFLRILEGAIRAGASASSSYSAPVIASRPAAPRRGSAAFGGEVILFDGPAKLLGDKRVRGFGGISFPLIGRVRGGLGASLPLSFQTVVDEGRLVVTDRRLVVAGERQTKTVAGRSLLAAENVGGRIMIRPGNGRVFVVETDRPEQAAGAIRSLIELSS